MSASVDSAGFPFGCFVYSCVREPVEALKPANTFNPVLQRFYQTVQQRALDPATALAPLEPIIAPYMLFSVLFLFL